MPRVASGIILFGTSNMVLHRLTFYKNGIIWMNIYKTSFLILGLIFFSMVRAETCEKEYHGEQFDVVAIYDEYLKCFYECPWPSPCASYIKIGHYIPIDGPWSSTGELCRGRAKDCRFQIASKK